MATKEQVLLPCYKLGWKFYLADLLNEYNIGNKEDIEKYINNVVDAKLVEYYEAKTLNNR